MQRHLAGGAHKRGLVEGTSYLLYLGPRFASLFGLPNIPKDAPTALA